MGVGWDTNLWPFLQRWHGRCYVLYHIRSNPWFNLLSNVYFHSCGSFFLPASIHFKYLLKPVADSHSYTLSTTFSFTHTTAIVPRPLQVPTDTTGPSKCGAHYHSDIGWHYHANFDGEKENAFLSCYIG